MRNHSENQDRQVYDYLVLWKIWRDANKPARPDKRTMAKANFFKSLSKPVQARIRPMLIQQRLAYIENFNHRNEDGQCCSRTTRRKRCARIHAPTVMWSLASAAERVPGA